MGLVTWLTEAANYPSWRLRSTLGQLLLDLENYRIALRVGTMTSWMLIQAILSWPSEDVIGAARPSCAMATSTARCSDRDRGVPQNGCPLRHIVLEGYLSALERMLELPFMTRRFVPGHEAEVRTPCSGGAAQSTAENLD